MIFDAPIPFREAVKQLAARKVMPTSLSSSELAQLNREVMRTSFTSARTTLEGLLERYKVGVESILNPQQVLREGATQTVTEGMDPASLRAFIKGYLKEIQYRPEEGTEGTIKDLSSDARINLVVKTNVELAQGAGKFVQGNADEDVVDLWPAWELVRYEDRDEPRDWAQRWRLAAQVAGDPKAAACLGLSGRMCALKSSGIWQALGDGEGGYEDTLGNPFPPFAFNSGMWCDDVSRKEATDLGLIEEGAEAKPAQFDLGSLFKEAA